MTSRAGVTALCLAAGVLVLYTPGLTYSPPYLHEAEVLFGLQAHAIATNGHDVDGRFMPLYFRMQPIGDNVWFHPSIVYFTALILQVLPFTEWAIRFPSVLVAAIDVVLLYLIARRIFNRDRIAVAAAVMFALTPAHVVNSRIAMDYVYPLPFILGWVLCLLIFLERRRPLLLFVGTSLLGFGVYSYIASVVMMPVYLVFTWIALGLTEGRPWRLMVIAAAGFVWPLLMLPVWLYFHPAVVTETLTRYGGPPGEAVANLRGASLAAILEELRRPLRFSGVTGRVSLYWYFFDPAFLFLSGGYANVVNSTRLVGVFLLPLLVLVPVGLWRVIGDWRRPPQLLVLFGFFSAPLAACLVPEPYAVDREIQIVPFGVLLATFGLAWFFSGDSRRRARAGAMLMLLGVLQFAFFQYEYYGSYRDRAAYWFNRNHRGALEMLVEVAGRDADAPIYLTSGTDPYMQAYWRLTLIKHRREDLLQRTVYFKDESLDPGGVPSGSFLLSVTDDRQVAARAADGLLELLAEIQEPADPPFFRLFRRR